MSVYFPLILLILTIASAIIALVDKFCFEKKRRAALEALPDYASMDKKAQKAFMKPPLLADYARSLFLVFLIVLVVRSFIVAPFRVPTGSMLPTIQLNDFLLVNKFAYGVRFPVFNTKIFNVGEPKTGDVVVFRYPPYPGVDYIKTVIGVPGDHISYINKQLYINGKKVPTHFLQTTIEPDNRNLALLYPKHKNLAGIVKAYRQDIGGHEHLIYDSPIVPPTNFKNLVVPKGEYLVMGDNRGNSEDSRYWGFVPEKNLIGKAFMVVFSWDAQLHKVRWDRLGKFLP